MKYLYLLICFNINISFLSEAQITDSIVTLNNVYPGHVIYSKIEIDSGATSNYQMITNGLSSLMSQCLNYQTNEYYLSGGTTLITIDASSGQIIRIDTFPISNTAKLFLLKFNLCDYAIYSILRDQNIYTLVRYFPSTNTIVNITNIPVTSTPCYGCLTVLDPDSNTLTIDTGNGIVGFDLSTGAMKYGGLKINLPGENFGHITLKCSTHEIIGTSANVSSGIKYLAKIDPYTGIVSHISGTPWNIGVWKPVPGGAAINQITGDYFYSGAGGNIIRINSNTGVLISAYVATPGELVYLDHFSTCKCSTIGPATVSEVNDYVNVTFNNALNEINIAVNAVQKMQLTIYDLRGKIIFKGIINNNQNINVSSWTNAMYIYEIQNETGFQKKGKLLVVKN